MAVAIIERFVQELIYDRRKKRIGLCKERSLSRFIEERRKRALGTRTDVSVSEG